MQLLSRKTGVVVILVRGRQVPTGLVDEVSCKAPRRRSLDVNACRHGFQGSLTTQKPAELKSEIRIIEKIKVCCLV